MTKPLEGRTVALVESRQLDELAQMLADEGATPLRYPLVTIRDADDPAPVHAWLRELAAGRFDPVVLMTGEGVRRLLSFAATGGMRDAYVEALGRVTTLSRGPKPVRALRELGLPTGLVSDAPTTEGVVATLGTLGLSGKTVGVVWHGEEVPALAAAVTAAGGSVAGVKPYRYAPDVDADHVAGLIRHMADGSVHLVVFTSTPQVVRLYEVAGERKMLGHLHQGFQRAKVAAVGPVVADALAKRGVRIDVRPETGFVMRNLVKHIVRGFAAPAAG